MMVVDVASKILQNELIGAPERGLQEGLLGISFPLFPIFSKVRIEIAIPSFQPS